MTNELAKPVSALPPTPANPGDGFGWARKEFPVIRRQDLDAVIQRRAAGLFDLIDGSGEENLGIVHVSHQGHLSRGVRDGPPDIDLGFGTR